MPAMDIKNHERSIRESLLERFNNREMIIDGDCILWSGVKTPDGYGYIKQMSTRSELVRKSTTIFVHRLAYQQAYGDIPTGMVVDHTCHDPKDCTGGKDCKHRSCINPTHLKLSTFLENKVRSVMTSSVKGRCRNDLHEWNEENVRVLGDGKQVCYPCKKAQAERARLRREGK